MSFEKNIQASRIEGLIDEIALLGGLAGSGTLNYIAKFTPNGATLGASSIFDNGTNVGIGTASPTAKLDVSSTVGYLLSINNPSIGSSFIVDNNGGLTVLGAISGGSSGIDIGNYTRTVAAMQIISSLESSLKFKQGGSESLVIQSAASGNYFDYSKVSYHRMYNNSIYYYNNSDPILTIDSGGKVGVGTTTVSSRLHIKGVDSTSSNYALKVDDSASSPLFYVRNDGNVGIGIVPTMADVKLEVKVATDQRFLFRNFTYPSIGAALTLQNINDATTDVTNVVTLGLDWYHASRNNLFSNGNNTIIPTAKVHIIGNNQASDLFALKVDNLGLNPLLYVRNDGLINIGGLTPSQIVETDASKNLVSVAKGTAYNKNFGTGTTNVVEIGSTLGNKKPIITSSSGKLQTSDWVDIISSCTFVGWSAYTDRVVDVLDMGTHYLLHILVTGTSNSATTTIQLPYTSLSTNNGAGLFADNGITIIGRWLLSNGGNTITFGTSAASNTWTASGTKSVGINIWFKK